MSSSAQLLETIYSSMSANPEILSLEFRSEPSTWALMFDARFANDCLADTGANLGYLDLPLHGLDIETQVRVLLLEQEPSVNGCPDIYRPVIRSYVAEMRRSPTVKRFIVLDHALPTPNTNEALQTYTIEAAEIRAAPADKSARASISARPLFESDSFPVVSSMGISHEILGIRKSEYSVQFDLIYPTRCHAEKGVYAKILESRSVVRQKEAAQLIDWLFIVNAGTAACPETYETQIKKSFMLKSEILRDYKRKLAVINRFSEKAKVRDMDFEVFDIN